MSQQSLTNITFSENMMLLVNITFIFFYLTATSDGSWDRHNITTTQAPNDGYNALLHELELYWKGR